MHRTGVLLYICLHGTDLNGIMYAPKVVPEDPFTLQTPETPEFVCIFKSVDNIYFPCVIFSVGSGLQGLSRRFILHAHLLASI